MLAVENPITRPFNALFTFVGEVTLLSVQALARIFQGKFERAEILNQMAFVGVSSVPIVALTGFFSGGVFALYLSTFLLRYGATQFVGGTVGLAIAREIGPVLAGIMVAARCGSAMAAQIGTMKVTEQIDALKMLSVNPVNYLVLPRLIASVLMLPILAMICLYSGIFGGWLVAVINHIDSDAFLQSLRLYLGPDDIWRGLIKAPVFGFLISIVACQQGLRTSEGAVGVGRATTNTVVVAMILVYMANFFLAQILFN